jgi:hypothetical protein
VVQRLFGFVWSIGPHPSEPIRNPMDVRIYADVPDALERQNHHEVRGFSPDARQR